MMEDQENSINLKEELFKYLTHWRWFVLSVFISLVCAFLYLQFTPKSYSVSTKILIKDEKSNDLANQLSAFSEMNLLGNSKNNIENEIEILKSRTLIYNTLDSLKLNILYLDKSEVVAKDLYKKSPVHIIWNNNDLDKTVSIELKNIKNNSFDVKVNDENIGNTTFGKIITSEFGSFVINKSKTFGEIAEMEITVYPKMKHTEDIQKILNVAPSSKTSSVIDLSIIGKNSERVADFLNTLVYHYNLVGVKDKRYISENTSEFISERLNLIATELGDVESQVEGYKNSNNLSDIQTEIKLYLDNLSSFEKSVLENETKINVVNSLINHVSKAKPDDMVPGGLLNDDQGAENIIQEINQLILEKQRMTSATAENPNYIKLEEQIRSLKSNLLASLRRNLSSLQIVKTDLKRQENEMQTKLAQVPRQEREFRYIDRQQKVKEALYLFLLQKREETNITLAATDMNAKVIDKAIPTDKPVAPKSMIILLAALIIGGLIPFITIYVRNLLDTKIKSRFDITDNTTIPFLGDIPTSESSNELMEISSRTSAAEAIRIVRTNLDFILSDKDENECKTIFLTSTVSGEGKTFVSANLAATFSLSDKKVILVGLDLRNPKLYEYLKVNPLGITNYITTNGKSIDEYIIPVEGYENFDVLSSGSIPPNPTEILMSKRIKELFDLLKEKYDYIIVDTAPISLVTDTLLISKYADATIYVVRANKIDKEMLRIPNELYKEQKLNKLTIVLNDSDVTKGYGYGYGYGYGAKVENKPLWKKILGIK